MFPRLTIHPAAHMARPFLHTFTFAFLEGVPVLSFCLTVINTPFILSFLSTGFYFSVPGKFVLITPKQGNEGAVQTLAQAGSDLLVAAFILTSKRQDLPVPGFTWNMEDSP